jgi:DNA-binding XRE family transcriptional regulator
VIHHHCKWRNHLYRLRRSRGLQQKHLAILLGYRGTATVSRLEAGSVLPSTKVALLIELVLGARLQEIYIDQLPHLRALLLQRAKRLPPTLVRYLQDQFTERYVDERRDSGSHECRPG